MMNEKIDIFRQTKSFFFFLPLVNPNEKPTKSCSSELKLKNLLKAVFKNQTHRIECDTKTNSRQEICV